VRIARNLPQTRARRWLDPAARSSGERFVPKPVRANPGLAQQRVQRAQVVAIMRTMKEYVIDGSRGETKSPARAACLAAWLGVAMLAALPERAPAASLFLQVETPALTLTPTPGDYVRDYIEATGTTGISVRIKTNDPVGMSVLLRCSDPAPQIALNDFMVRTLTGPGPGGSALSTYTPIQSTNMFLWSTGTELAPFFIVRTDIRIRNLMNYNDGAGAATTGYSNTLVFTVVSP